MIWEETKTYINAVFHIHYDNTPMQYSVIFHGCKNGNFQMKNCDIFLIFAHDRDRGYRF